jgi:hypothetical protein
MSATDLGATGIPSRLRLCGLEALWAGSVARGLGVRSGLLQAMAAKAGGCAYRPPEIASATLEDPGTATCSQIAQQEVTGQKLCRSHLFLKR